MNQIGQNFGFNEKNKTNKKDSHTLPWQNHTSIKKYKIREGHHAAPKRLTDKKKA